MHLVFIDGNDLRAREIREVTGAELGVAALQTGFSTSAPEPGQRARDKVLAHAGGDACFAEAVDLTNMDGRSLRLELDTENANRFCKYYRETPARMVLQIALRRAPGAEIEMFGAVCDGCIANKPVGTLALGWDRLFVPGTDAGAETLAQLAEAGELVEFRRRAYGDLARALGL